MSLRTWLRSLFFPPRCLGCGKRLSASLDFCSACGTAFEREMRAQCPDCFLEYASCRCMPAVMKKARIKTFLKLTPYGEGVGRRITRRMLSHMKKRSTSRAFTFCATELAAILRPALAELSAGEEERPAVPTVLAWLPRSRRSVRRYGFDQAEMLARAVAAEMGLPALPLLLRRRDARPQKGLSLAARRRNLRGAFALGEDARGLRVILVDDLVTTGAGMAEAARLVRRGGAESVLALSLAATERRRSRG